MWWGAPHLIHPGYQFQEPHYTAAGFDDVGVRDMSRRVHQVLPTFEHAILNENIDCRRVVQESVNILRALAMPPIPSIHRTIIPPPIVKPQVPCPPRYRGLLLQVPPHLLLLLELPCCSKKKNRLIQRSMSVSTILPRYFNRTMMVTGTPKYLLPRCFPLHHNMVLNQRLIK